MNYLEAKPSPDISSSVRCFWSMKCYRGPGPTGWDPVLPDGCPEIVFNFADCFQKLRDDQSIETQEKSLVSGQLLRRVLIRPTGAIDLFGIRFEPAGAIPFLRAPLSDLIDCVEPLDAVIGIKGRLYWEELAEASSFEGRIEIAERMIKLSAQRKGIDQAASEACRIFASSDAQIRNRLLADKLGISERTLERKFAEQVGVPPKTFQRIVRFQKAVARLSAGFDLHLPAMALDLGFFDQPHMNREFRQFAGMTPLEYLKGTHQISDMFVSSN